MGARVTVAGASGYAGGELLRLLSGHPDLEIGPLAAQSSAGKPVSAVHPHLQMLDGAVFTAADPELLADADLLFTALPHGESARLAHQLPARVKIIDLGADFRLADAANWERFYQGPHAGRWVYGLPELPGTREAIRAARTVAAPGCYATAAILALAPLLGERRGGGEEERRGGRPGERGLIDPAGIVIVAASGTSGAGRAARADLLASEVMGSVRAYEVGGTHRHTPEIEQALAERSGRPVRLSFTPLLAPMPRGILATISAPLAPGVSEAELREALHTAYENEPFVRVLPVESWPVSGATTGSNAAHLQVTADEHAGRAVVVSAIDNLGKGAAGQAVQIANIMLGLPETAGLTVDGVAP